MYHGLWLHRDGGQGPWPVYLDTHSNTGLHAWIERQCIGLYYSAYEPSGIYLRSLKQQARTKIESLIAMESYQ